MSAVLVSRLVRTEVESRFAALFNAAVQAACVEFGAPELAVAINWGESPELPNNFFRGDRQAEDLRDQELDPEFPAVAVWDGDGAADQVNGQKWRTFSGDVRVYWRWFLFVPGVDRRGLIDLMDAVQSAMLSTIRPEFLTIGYRGDLAWLSLPEKKLFNEDRDHFGWMQEVTYTCSFEVNV